MFGPTQGRSVYIVHVRYVHVTLQVCFEVKMFASNARLHNVQFGIHLRVFCNGGGGCSLVLCSVTRGQCIISRMVSGNT